MGAAKDTVKMELGGSTLDRGSKLERNPRRMQRVAEVSPIMPHAAGEDFKPVLVLARQCFFFLLLSVGLLWLCFFVVRVPPVSQQ
jgi:hypothetical protein